MTCQQVYRCVKTTTYQGRDGQDYTSKNVTGTCTEGGSCAVGDCQSVSVCISPSACGCQGLPSTHRPTMFLLLFVVLLALGVRKRRHPAS
ncbi:MAG TPA: hypothetical protein DCE42_22475 [Myxococcales bacterium]|nr:hypothetical protein [Deltaproteobacteria bacterium]HAA57549.1 hypothetical protein [Myxococcales bacterium]